MNVVFLQGRLSSDPVLRELSSGSRLLSLEVTTSTDVGTANVPVAWFDPPTIPDWGAGIDVPFLHFGVCYYEGIRFCIEQGLDVFEPGAGGEHKRARGFVPTMTRSAHWLADARLRGVLGPWLVRERARVAELLTES